MSAPAPDAGGTAAGETPGEAAASGDRYSITVADTGPGIAAEDQKKLFNKFFRVENSLNRDIGGTGLGLALVKHIALVHQGEVGVQSELGKGATFRLSLPRQATPAQHVKPM